MGFTPSHADPSLYILNDPVLGFILVYVDDLIIAAKDDETMAQIKKELMSRFPMTDMGELTNYLGIEITRNTATKTISLSQASYINAILREYHMEGCSPVQTPLPQEHGLTDPAVGNSCESPEEFPRMVGSLMYVMVGTRPDLAYPMSALSRQLAPGRATQEHLDQARRVLRYLKGTIDKCLVLGGVTPPVLTGYSDSSWADDHTDRRSTQGYGFTLGSGLISWRSTRSSAVALSSCEAELYAATMAAQEAQWLMYLLEELGYLLGPAVLKCDNSSVIHLTEEPKFHRNTKHIHLRHFFIRELVQQGRIVMQKVPSDCNVADLFTKALDRK